MTGTRLLSLIGLFIVLALATPLAIGTAMDALLAQGVSRNAVVALFATAGMLTSGLAALWFWVSLCTKRFPTALTSTLVIVPFWLSVSAVGSTANLMHVQELVTTQGYLGDALRLPLWLAAQAAVMGGLLTIPTCMAAAPLGIISFFILNWGGPLNLDRLAGMTAPSTVGAR